MILATGGPLYSKVNWLSERRDVFISSTWLGGVQPWSHDSGSVWLVGCYTQQLLSVGLSPSKEHLGLTVVCRVHACVRAVPALRIFS